MLTDTPAWKALATARAALEGTDFRAVTPPLRALKLPGITLDYSRHRVDDNAMEKLFDLARQQDVAGWRDRMFAGDIINASEKRAVLHTALRRPPGEVVTIGGLDVMPFIHGVLNSMEDFCDAVHTGRWRGHTGHPVRHVVNIGIGGSDLGPRMVCHALRRLRVPDIAVHFVSNVDGADIESVLSQCAPEYTLFLVASKTFTTQETMKNAATARQWLIDALGEDDAVKSHFVALSTNETAVAAFGIAPENMFPFRDWVGGRYSLWSAIGLPIALAVGFDNFRELLRGGNAMDRHFQYAPLESNMPVIMALLGLWYRNFWDAQSCAAIPYARDLALMPQWLQQTDMESNGKSVTKDGHRTTYDTGPVVFGTPGTDGQHAYFQLIHQGTALIPCDFIAPLDAPSDYEDHHRILLANMAAQSQALWQGRDLAASAGDPQKEFTGGRPSSLVLLDRLDPFHLGLLLALYEHKVFVQGILWNINSFDQWGVELGKILANKLLESGAPLFPAADS